MVPPDKDRVPPDTVEAEPDLSEISQIRKVLIFDSIGRHIVKPLIFGATIIGGLYVTFALPIKYSAGEETTIRHVVQWAANMSVDKWIAYCAAGVFGGLWWRERRLRKDTVWREHVRTEKMEKRTDPNRTSSGFDEIDDRGPKK